MRWLAPFLFLSCGVSTPLPGHVEQPIVGGAAAPAAASTFLLDLRFQPTSASICSAVLISERVLLTAAHCVDPAFHEATSVTVRAVNEPDDTMLMPSDAIGVTLITLHPQWVPTEQESAFDVAVMLLERAPVGVAPVALRRVAPSVGQSMEVVGYGRASAADGQSSGTRRSVVLPATGVTAREISFGTSGGAGICSGDSGGPSFIDGEVAGVHSRTESTSCGKGVDIRVDASLAFIDAFVRANDPTFDAGLPVEVDAGLPEVDAGVDAGVIERDAGSSLLDDGSPCSSADQCDGAACIADPRGFSFCSRACVDDSVCASGLVCSTGFCRGVDEEEEPPVHGGCSTAPSVMVLLACCSGLVRARRSRARAHPARGRSCRPPRCW